MIKQVEKVKPRLKFKESKEVKSAKDHVLNWNPEEALKSKLAKDGHKKKNETEQRGLKVCMLTIYFSEILEFLLLPIPTCKKTKGLVS